MTFAVLNAKYNDPKSNAFDTRNVLVQGNKITGVGYIPDEDEETLTIVDATKSVLIPGVSDFIFLPHIDSVDSSLNQLFEYGIQSVVFLPNPNVSCLDSPDQLASFLKSVPDLHQHDVAFAACATKGNGVDQLTEFSVLAQAGAKAIYFDRVIENPKLFVEGLKFMNLIDCPIIFGPMTSMQLSQAHLNEGITSFEIGVRGEPISIEEKNVAYVLSMLDEYYQGAVHFLSISSAESIRTIHQFNHSRSMNVSVGVCPYHLLITDGALLEYDVRLKFNPPLRDEKNRLGLIDALKQGLFNHFTSLHVPATGDIYPKSFYEQLFGMETISNYLDLVSHLLIENEVSLGDYAKFLQLPDQLNLFSTESIIDIHQTANFSIIRSDKNIKNECNILGVIDKSCYGGLVASVKNGTLYKV